MKKRILVLLTVMALMVVMLAMSVAPAFAQGRSESAPNCALGQDNAWFHQAINPSSNDKPEKHFSRFLECAA